MENTRSRLISLIIPTYNCIEFLDETLDSVLHQLPDDCELIVVDDGSADGTAGKLAEMKGAKSNVTIALREHAGVSGARNAGLDIAVGEYICFMDCDDLLEEDFFSSSIPLLGNASDLYIFSFDRVELGIDENAGERTETAYPMKVSDRVFGSASDFADEYIRNRHLLIYSACNKYYRRDIIEENGIRFKEGLSFGEDRLFNYEYIKHAGVIQTSAVRMFKYMQRDPESASNRHFHGCLETVMMLHEAKMDCILGLSKETSEEERKKFRDYDFAAEMEFAAEHSDDRHDEN